MPLACDISLAAKGFPFVQLDVAICPHPSTTFDLTAISNPYPTLQSGFPGLTISVCCVIASALRLLRRLELENATKEGLE
jgi:hypothetical protein